MPFKDAEKRKEYHRAYMRSWGENNPEKRREHSKKAMRKWRNEDPERAAKKMREWRATNPGKSYRSAKKYKEENPEKFAAHLEVKKAIARGELKRLPCEECGSLRSQAHHEDYSKPLEVRWLCQKHHSRLHCE